MKKFNLVYNVLIGGVSIGLTRNLVEAQDWVRDSTYTGSKVIKAFPDHAMTPAYG